MADSLALLKSTHEMKKKKKRRKEKKKRGREGERKIVGGEKGGLISFARFCLVDYY